MPQYLADFGQRGPVPQHLRRQRVAKLMGTRRRRLNAGALERMPNDRAHASLALKAADGRFAAQKHATTGAAGAPVTQVRGDRCARIRGKGQGGSVTAFASDAHLADIPVNILELEQGHFA